MSYDHKKRPPDDDPHLSKILILKQKINFIPIN